MNTEHSVVEEEERTLIMVSRRPTEPKTALAGVILATSFARFIASIARFSEEMVPSRPFSRRDLASIVQTRRSGKKRSRVQVARVGQGASSDEDGGPPYHDRSRNGWLLREI